MTLKPKNHALSAGVVAVSTLFGVALCVTANDASAAGFEKANLWSGKYAGIGSAATAIVNDSEALYFNPAGLAAAAGLQASLNISPTWSTFKGPITSSTQITSETSLTPPFGVFASLRPTEKLGVGLGIYSAGGSRASYQDVDFSALFPAYTTIKPELKSELTLIEYSLGAGYELIDGLRLGVAYRISHASGSFSSGLPGTTFVGATPTSVAAVDVKNASGTRYNGWRVGAQYAPKESNWGLGAYWRNKVEYSAKAKVSGQLSTILAPTTVTELSEQDATLSLPLPQQIGIGAYYALGEKKETSFHVDYTFTQYHDVDSLGLQGNLALASGTVVGQLSNLALNWSNESKYRFGVQHQLSDMLALRAGYVYISQVTPTNLASAAFSPPGPGHAASLGSGQKIMDGFLEFNEAVEYTWGKADGTNNLRQTGTYQADAWVIHLGASMHM